MSKAKALASVGICLVAQLCLGATQIIFHSIPLSVSRVESRDARRETLESRDRQSYLRHQLCLPVFLSALLTNTSPGPDVKGYFPKGIVSQFAIYSIYF
ncbi:hypothetical protein F4824DRAFT_481811 [Ustulina deusta]|nr:hypothetical protein F4824DRAFT_481811 [Ustulina deusta]